MAVVRAALLFVVAAVAVAQQPSGPALDNNTQFTTVPPLTQDSLSFEAQLPNFEGKDLQGRVWSAADLRGKLTVIDVWNTFGVSIDGSVAHHYNEEHPDLQRFSERIKDAKNIQVLTFCTDFDYTHARAYMTRNHFTFPVIADWQLAKKLFGSVANIAQLGVVAPQPGTANRSCPIRFPEQWVVCPDGRLSARFCSWSFGRILTEAERAASAN